MGIIQEEYIIAQTYEDDEGVSKVDEWISKLPEEWRKHFAKLPCHTNGYLTYFMNWDGSKEGWNPSETGNELRGCFCAILNNSLTSVHVLHIKPEGDVYEESSIEERRDTDILPLEDIFGDEPKPSHKTGSEDKK